SILSPGLPYPRVVNADKRGITLIPVSEICREIFSCCMPKIRYSGRAFVSVSDSGRFSYSGRISLVSGPVFSPVSSPSL
ncbi:MAG TPA: hypothetical protein DF409_03540, partial [Bacteroidales bacterium]|nr:hypothetical protein [Bacteroidales bacterium]